MRKTLINAIAHYGAKPQLIVAIEEMAELQKELTKVLRGFGNAAHLAEEIADVEIMLAQLKLIFLCERDMEEWRKKKLERLEERIGGAERGD